MREYACLDNKEKGEMSSSAASALSASCLLNEVVHKRRSVARGSSLALSTELLVQEETLKDGIAGEGEHTHEDGSNEETNEGCDYAGEVGRRHLRHYLRPLGHLQVANQHCHANYEHTSEEQEDPAH